MNEIVYEDSIAIVMKQTRIARRLSEYKTN